MSGINEDLSLLVVNEETYAFALSATLLITIYPCLNLFYPIDYNWSEKIVSRPCEFQ